jgi:hypothetical protein
MEEGNAPEFPAPTGSWLAQSIMYLKLGHFGFLAEGR